MDASEFVAKWRGSEAGIVTIYAGADYAGSREELRERCEAAFAAVEA